MHHRVSALPAPRAALALATALFALTAAGCDPSTSRASTADEYPSSVILLMADGAGLAHWTMALFEDDESPLYRMPVTGLVDTRGSDHVVSGSAPTATAYSIGERSFMGAIGVNGDSVPGESVTEVAQGRGWSTGVMTTTAVVDATPAAFSAHVPSRYQYAEIARQMVARGHTVVLGGGGRPFGAEEQQDGGALLDEIRANYTWAGSIEELRALDPDTVDSLFGLLAEGEMGPIPERDEEAFQDMVSAGIAVLSRDPDGFFLMAENEETDSRSHANDPVEIIETELRDFLESVEVALAYQEANPGTLVIVTSDHETGGITLPYRDRSRDPVMEYSTGGHTGIMVPIFARGPGAERFSGVLRNDQVGQILKELVGGR
jgi:alkaline phosphatase